MAIASRFALVHCDHQRARQPGNAVNQLLDAAGWQVFVRPGLKGMISNSQPSARMGAGK